MNDDKKTILIIAGPADSRQGLRRLLEARDFFVMEAADAGEGMQLLGQCNPDLLILDQHLSDISGLVLLQNLRTSDDRPAIMLCADGDHESVVQALRSGADDYIFTPCTDDLATMTVERVVREMKTKHRLREADMAADAAIESSRLKDAYLASIGHGLRTPLTTILGYSQLLRNAEDISIAAGAMAATIHDASKRLAAVIDDILLVTDAEGGRNNPKSASIGDILDALCEQAKDKALAKRVGVICEPFGQRHLKVRSDCILPALQRIVDNAVKYTERGEVCISARRDGDHAFISVRDTGPGIAACDRDRIFERFVKLNGSEETEGSGVGLYIAKRLVEAADGTIETVSRTGRGSVFTVKAPIIPGEQSVFASSSLRR